MKFISIAIVPIRTFISIKPFSQQFGVREITLMPTKKEEHAQDWRVVDDIEVENVDQIVYNSLNAVDSDLIDKKLLVDIYNNL